MEINDRKILAKACGLVWHEITETNGYYRCSCGASFHGLESLQARRHAEKSNPTFTTPDDWELVRVKVVVPNLDEYADAFDLVSKYAWLLQSPEDNCQDAVTWIRSRPDLFPWVREQEVK